MGQKQLSASGWALARPPGFENGVLRKLFGSRGTSVFRGGFGITNDYYGQQLAVQFDLNNALGFGSNTQIPPNMYNVSDNPAPRFTGSRTGRSVTAWNHHSR